MRSKHTGHVGSYSGFQGDQSTVNPNGKNERLQQSRDVGGGDRGPKLDILESEPVSIEFALLNIQGLSTKSNPK